LFKFKLFSVNISGNESENFAKTKKKLEPVMNLLLEKNAEK